MVLRECHEPRRWQVRTGLPPGHATRRALPLPGKPFGQATRQQRCRQPRAGVVGVVPLMLAGHQNVQRVVIIIIPLGLVAATQPARLVALVFQHQMHLPSTAHAGVHFVAQLLQEGIGIDRMHGIQPQPVEAVLVQPHQRVVDEETTHLGLAEVDGTAPWRAAAAVEERGCVLLQQIAHGPEVVVNHIQQHRHALPMRGVDQCFQRFWPTVGLGRCIGKNAVIAPVAASRELRHRHQLKCGDTHRGERGQLRTQTIEAAAAAEMDFVDDQLVPGPALPVGRQPCVVVFGQDRARSFHAMRLPA